MHAQHTSTPSALTCRLRHLRTMRSSFCQPDQLNRIWVLPASKCNWERYDPKTWHAVMFSSVHQSFSNAPAIRPMPSETDPSHPTDAPQTPDTQEPPDQPDHPMPDPRPPTPPDENMSDPPPDPPHQPDHPTPPAPRGVSPDSPVGLPPHNRQRRFSAQTAKTVHFILKKTQSTGG